MFTVNLVLIVFLAFMAYWWSSQGLFSSLIHLLLTIFCGLLAFALWEPLVYGLIYTLMPDGTTSVESAWGIGLLLPFAATLLLFRPLFDRLVPGNIQLPHMANTLGGGACGLASGILTAGIVVIGSQMVGMPSLWGYVGWDLEAETGEPVRTETRLWVPVDSQTAGFFTMLSDNAFNPLPHDRSLGRVHPNLAIEAAFFNQTAGEWGRHSIRDANAELVEGGYFRLSELNEPLKTRMNRNLPPNEQLVVVGTKVMLQAQDKAGAADNDGVFRVTRNQVALVSGNGQTHVTYPMGYMQAGQYRPLLIQGEYAYSLTSVADVTHHWVFAIPQGWDPQFIRLKQLRLDLPPQASDNASAIAELANYEPPAETAEGEGEGSTGVEPGNPEGKPSGAQAEFVEISDVLPTTLNLNALRSEGVNVVDGAIRQGSGSITGSNRRLGKNLAVDNIYHNKQTEIVQVKLGSRNAQSLLGKIFDTVTTNTQPPLLIDNRGREYFAVGYGIERSAAFTFSIDPNAMIRSLSQIDLGSVSEDDTITLYYQIPKGVTLNEFRIGQSITQSMNLTVPRDD